MKTKYIAIITVLLIFSNCCKAQLINWVGLKETEKHIINLQIGIDHGLVYGIGYSYQPKSTLPILINLAYSIPSGDNLLDDYKAKMGVDIKLLEANHVVASVNASGIFRSYENTMVQLLNFGANLNTIVGYYRSKWFIAGEIGFDKAIVTRFKHKDAYKENFPGVKDGWYEPATGGNFQYGLQIGYTFHKGDIYLKGGKVTAQDFKTKPTIPLYLQVGYNLKL